MDINDAVGASDPEAPNKDVDTVIFSSRYLLVLLVGQGLIFSEIMRPGQIKGLLCFAEGEGFSSQMH